MNTKKTLLFPLIFLILLVISACGPATETTSPTQDGALLTAIVDTAQAETIQAAIEGTQTHMAISTTSTSKAMISVSKETNCRLGPDVVYERVGQLDPGVMAEVFALDPGRGYYYIENPGNPGTYCWVWGEFATPVNDLAVLPIYTPAHTPLLVITSTPELIPSETCTFVSQYPGNDAIFTPGQLDVDFEWIVKNTGSTTWYKANMDYEFVSGQNLHGMVTISNLTADIYPDKESTLLLDLIVPNDPGLYTETWALVRTYPSIKTFCSVTFTIEVK